MKRLVFALLLLGCKRSGPAWAPDDEVLRKRFDDHRAEFNAIADYFDTHPGFRGYSPNFAQGPSGECHTPGRGAGPPFVCGTKTVNSWSDVETEIGLSFATLRDDLREIGFCSVSRGAGGDLVYYLSCSHDASWGKDIVLAKTAPSPIVADTTRDQTRLLSVYASLGGAWYIHRSGAVP